MRIVFLGNFAVPFSSENHHAESLAVLGHTVLRLQEREIPSEAIEQLAMQADIFVWIHTHGWHTPGKPMRHVLFNLKSKGIPSLTYHLDLWMGLERQKDMNSDDYWAIEHFFTVDKLMADYLTANTNVKGHYLHAGVFHKEATRVPHTELAPYDVAFVGSKGYHPEWPYRPQLIDFLAETYGDRFAHYGGDGRGVLRGLPLNRLYSDMKVIVGDSLCINFDYPYYWSDRIFETTGRGGFIIHPYIKGLEDCFEDGKEVVFYKFGDFNELKDKIDYYIANTTEREAIRMAGHERTKRDHTYLNRWKTIIETVMPQQGTA